MEILGLPTLHWEKGREGLSQQAPALIAPLPLGGFGERDLPYSAHFDCPSPFWERGWGEGLTEQPLTLIAPLLLGEGLGRGP